MKDKISIIHKIILAAVLFLFTSPVFAAITGSGTRTDPFIISTVADWNTFASNINSGTNASSYYKLSDSFDNSSNPITTMCGIHEEKYFNGVFDGNGKTLYVQLSSTQKYAAPFSYARNATINNLTVAGTITTSEMHAGGFIGEVYGTINFNNCISYIEITSTVDGDGTHAGFVGIAQDDKTQVYFNSCIFKGKLFGTRTHSCAGFVGWNRGKCEYYDCVFAPAEITMKPKNSANFNRNNKNTLKNCYYLSLYGDEQGINASEKTNEELLALLGDNWHIVNGSLLPIQASNSLGFSIVDSLESYYVYTGDTVLLDYNVSIYGTPLIKDTDYYEIIRNPAGEIITNLVEKGDYYLVVKGKGNYSGAKKVAFKVIFYGTGEETDPYIIETTFDWNSFAELSNASTGECFKGKYFSLENDLDFGKVKNGFISVSNTNWQWLPDNVTTFAGIFDGKGHCFSGIDNVSNGVFGKTSSDAVIKNLTVKDSTILGRNRVGVIVGINNGTVTNCHSCEDVYVYSGEAPNAGETYEEGAFAHGGIVGKNAGTVSGCSSAANVIARHSNNADFGGIVGYNSGTVKHCFYYGDRVVTEVSKGAIIGYNEGTCLECLHIAKSIGGISNYNSNNANYAYILTIKSEDIYLNIDENNSTNYGLITEVSGTLIIDGTIYAPMGQYLTLDFGYTGQHFGKDKLAFDYFFKDSWQSISETCIKNEEGKYEFRMPSSDVSFYAGYEWEGEGTQDEPYKIENIYQMDYLATRVNILEKSFEDEYFILDNDLTFDGSNNNYIPIGGYYNDVNREFCGTFDGNGKTISGININKTGNTQADSFAGVFGRIGSYGNVKNLNIQNSNITGYFACGSIAGFNAGYINNCSVESNVVISSTNSSSSCHGGISGYNVGTIEECKSSAKVYNSTAAGGITGYNKDGTITDCFYTETSEDSIKATASYVGFIIGHDENGNLQNNYCIGKELYAVGIASSGIDVAGAKKLYKIISTLVDNISFVQNQNGELDFEGFIYDSSLYAPANSIVKINLNSFSLSDNSVLILKAVDQSDAYKNINSFVNGVCTFTMPAFDTSIVTLLRTEQTDSVVTLQRDPYSQNVYYASFYNSTTTFKVPENTKVFYVIKAGNNKLSIEEEESGIINANQPVILQSSSQFITLELTDLTGSYTYQNLLLGTENAITAPQNSYILSFSQKGGVGFYKATGTIPAGKVYLLKEEDNE